ncbi:MAG: ATP-binding protein [Bacillota bacterium]|nr:ATP-binding protein [Bacillota bacterium]
MNCNNKRTLKKKIRRIISLCILVSILLFGGIIIYLTAQISKSEGLFLTDYYSNFIGNTMSSEYFIKQMGISGLENFDPNSPIARDWLQSLKDMEKPQQKDSGPDKDTQSGNTKPNPGFIMKPGSHMPQFDFPFVKPETLTSINITINGVEVYKSENWDNTTKNPVIINAQDKKVPFMSGLLNYFVTESTYNLLGSRGNVVGTVKARIDSGYVLSTYAAMASVIVIIGLICLVVCLIISKFFTASITKPLNQLNDKILAISKGDYKSTLNAKILLKRPPREIEGLASSTNAIMLKMKEYNELLESHKVTLENQNEELEAQNEELKESKQQIEDAQTMLVQNENMASIGQLTAAITHEINTPLGAINSNVQLFSLLVDSLEANPTIQADKDLSSLISQMKEANNVNTMACERVIQIIRSLKNFVKLDQAEFQEANINEGIKSVLILTSNLWKRKIKIHEEYGSVPMVKCFPGLLNQVFMNIIVNAIQSIEDTGDIFIKTWSDESMLVVSIKDTGCGISQSNLSRIFEPRFSTKESGVGAGLGLSISDNIIKKHKGEIKVTSDPGQGSEFMVSIPVNADTFEG